MLSVPLSVDVVGGFGSSPEGAARRVKAVVTVGAVGINIEDFVHDARRLLPIEKQTAKLRGLVRLQKSMRIPFVINARTDALRFAPGDDDARFQEAIRRAAAYRDVGADCVYPWG